MLTQQRGRICKNLELCQASNMDNTTIIPPNQTVLPHEHNGVDSPRVDGKNIIFPITATAPTDKAPNGTIRLYFTGTTYRIYARLNNVWKYKTLDNT